MAVVITAVGRAGSYGTARAVNTLRAIWVAIHRGCALFVSTLEVSARLESATTTRQRDEAVVAWLDIALVCGPAGGGDPASAPGLCGGRELVC